MADIQQPNRLSLLTKLLAVVFALLLLEKFYYETNNNCSCFPEFGSRIHLILLFVWWLLSVIVIILALKLSKWYIVLVPLVAPFVLFEFLDLIENNYSKDSIYKKRQKEIVAEYFMSDSQIKSTQNHLEGIELTLYKDSYAIITHDGPECGCIYFNEFSKNKNEIVLKNIEDYTENTITDNKFEIYQNKIRMLKDTSVYFTLFAGY